MALIVTGSFTGDKFVVQSDNHGGGDILPATASATALSPFGQYVAAGLHSPHMGQGTVSPIVPPLALIPSWRTAMRDRPVAVSPFA